jgi:outer membrane protein assembly factor BamA
MRLAWLVAFGLVAFPTWAWAQPPGEELAEADGAILADDSAVLAETGAPGFQPRYQIERIEVRGNAKTRTALILREVGLAPGDVVSADDQRVNLARLKLLTLGYFLDARLSMTKGARRGQAVLVVEVEERGTIVLDALHLGTSDATTLWGGLGMTERNFLGRGISLGAGFVGSTQPKVPDAKPGMALSLRVAGPPMADGPVLSAAAILSRGSEFVRARGSADDSDPDNFVASTTRRLGGTLGMGAVLSRTLYMSWAARFESMHASLPAPNDGQPIGFDIRDGGSRLGSLSLGLELDTRSDPVLPHRGYRLALGLEVATPAFASQYTFVKSTAQGSIHFPVRWGHVIAIHGLAGAIFGDAPYFDRFFVGDLNLLLPPRAQGINFSTQPSRNFLGTSVDQHRYDNFAARALVEYAIPLWSRHGLLYRGEAFVAFGAFALGNQDDFSARGWKSVPADLTADLGIRLDTYVGIFTLSVGNALGRIPF